MRINISNLVIGVGSGDNPARVILAPCRCQRNDIHDRDSIGRKCLVRDQIPGISIILCTGGDRLRAVEHASAAHSKYHVNIIFLTDLHTIQHARIIFRIRLYSGQFVDLLFFKQLLYFVIKSQLFNTSTAIGQKNLLPKAAHYFCQLLINNSLTKDQSCRCLVIKILHTVFLLLFSV